MSKQAFYNGILYQIEYQPELSNNDYTQHKVYHIKTENMTTDKQKAAIHFCEKWLNVTFNGDINNFQQVSNFLSEYLEEAKLTYEEIACEYESYLWDLMD